MKRILLIFPFLILCHLTQAQGIKIEKGMYKKNTDLKQFEGTWQGKKGDKTLVVVFEKHKVHYPGIDIYRDQILGWYKYLKNDQLLVNTLDKAGSSKYGDANFIGETKKNNLRKLSFTVATPNRETLLNATFKFTGKKSNRAILTFQLPKETDIKIKTRKSEGKHKNGSSKIPVSSTWHMKRIKNR